MARRPAPSFGDNMKGMWRSLTSGDGMKPIQTQRHIRQAQAERLDREARAGFGMGEPDGFGGDRNWSKPVHGTRADGRPVTIAYGKGPRSGEILVADGHITDPDVFYGTGRAQPKGHDHLLADGSFAADRNRHKE